MVSPMSRQEAPSFKAGRFTHQMGLQNKWFDAIENGYKVFELRLLDDKRQKIRVGDIIEFTAKDGRKTTRRVCALASAQTFADLFKVIPFNLAACPDVKFQEEMLSIMEEFYPVEKQEQLGVVAIGLTK